MPFPKTSALFEVSEVRTWGPNPNPKQIGLFDVLHLENVQIAN